MKKESPLHILVVEDNAIVAKNVASMLETNGFIVHVAERGDKGFDMASSFPYACIVLDIMLPGMDGVMFCKKLRQTRQTAVIMMTAKWQLDDKIEWFDVGADDYIVKPFALEELLLRINAIVKRTQLPSVLSYGGVALDVYTQRLFNGNDSILLPLKEFLLLEYLMQRSEKAISRTELIEYIRWGEAREHDPNLDVYIANLRKKLQYPLIQTIKWFWYILSNNQED